MSGNYYSKGIHQRVNSCLERIKLRYTVSRFNKQLPVTGGIFKYTFSV